MSNILRTVGGVALAVIALLLTNAAFIVPQTSSAIVFRFGRVERPPIKMPGLYFKVPFMDNVTYLDNRVLDNDLRPQEVLAADQKNLVVDAFTRYRITDPLRFFQSVNNVARANQTLESIVNSRLRSVLAGATTKQIIDTDRGPPDGPHPGGCEPWRRRRSASPSSTCGCRAWNCPGKPPRPCSSA